MLNISSAVFSLVGILCLIFFGCNPENKLEKVIEKELATGIRNDSLFLELEFGITMQEFYDHCRELNRQGIVMEGSKNMSVEYIFKDSLDQPIAFNFYADRDADGPIHRYYTSFYYYAFALNRHLYSDRLMEMLPAILKDWYGGNKPFTVMKDGKEYLYKIDGNRMIELSIYDLSTVTATYYDLSQINFQELEQ
jgi:hypothetical protein